MCVFVYTSWSVFISAPWDFTANRLPSVSLLLLWKPGENRRGDMGNSFISLSSRITNWSAAQIGIKPSLHIKGAMDKRERWERNETKQACKYCISIEKVLVFIHITMWWNLPKKMSLISQLFLLDGDDIKWRANVGCILLIVLLKILNVSFSFAKILLSAIESQRF